MAGRTLAEVWVAVRPDTSGTGREIARNLGRDNSIDRVGHQHGHNYGAAVVKGATAPIRGGFGLLWRGVAAGAAAVGVGRILTESVKGFREHQKTVAQTAQVIKSTGGAAKVSVGAVTRLSDALERKTKVDGDVIQSGSNMLLTFTNVQNRAGKGNDIFNQATKSVLDMSVALGTDAPQSAIQLGKALNDPVKGVSALQRVGLTFTEQQKEQIAAMTKAGNVAGAQKVVLAELNKEFGGSAKAQGDALGAQGRLTVAWRQAQDTIGSALLPVVNELEDGLAKRLPGAADKAAAGIAKGALGVKAMIAAFREGDVTSDGLIGGMERVGVIARQLQLGVRALVAAYQEGDVTSSGFVGGMERIGVSLRKVHDWLATVDFHSLATQAGDLGAKLKTVDFAALFDRLKNVETANIGAGFRVTGAAVGFLADHIDLLVKSLPVLIALFALYKATQAAANVTDLVSIPVKIAQVASNVVLAGAIRSLAAAQAEQTGTQLVNTAVTGAGTAAMVQGRLSVLASTAAMIAQKAVTLAVSAATKAWAAVQWLLNAALVANPIGLVIAVVAALAAGIVYAYKHSETFRRIVDGAFRAVATAGQWMWEHVLRPTFRYIADAFLGLVGGIVNGAATAFGWVPKLGPKLRAAAAEFNGMAASINRSLSGLHDKNIAVTAHLRELGIVPTTTAGLAKGGVVPFVTDGPRAIVGEGNRSRPEYVIPTDPVHRKRALQLYEDLGTKLYAGGGVLGFKRGLTVSPRLEGKERFDAALAAYDQRLSRLAARIAKLDGGGAGLLPFMQAHAGIPYVWGGVSPTGIDCSGWISVLANKAQGQRNPWHRRFSTGNLPAGMFAPGLGGRFQIGWFVGNPGHVAATIGGVNTEARGGDGVVVGRGARSARSSLFSRHGHLKGFAAGGILPGDPPFDLLSMRGRYPQAGLLDWLLGDPFVADAGVRLPPGPSIVDNRTGRPETLRPDGQPTRLHPRDIQALVEGIGGVVARGIGAANYTVGRTADLYGRSG